MTIENNKLKETLVLGASLPSEVFHHKFDRHLFFDIDISTSDELMLAVQKVVRGCFGLDGRVEVYSALGYESLGQFCIAEDWVPHIMRCEKTLRNAGIHDGLILIDASKQWILYQPCPVDLGIFAFNSQVRVEEILSDVYDYFFSCEDIKNWISQKTVRDAALVSSFGLEFLTLLVKNYCR